MDIVRTQKKRRLPKKISLLMACIGSLLLAVWFVLPDNSTYLAHTDSILMDTVKRGEMTISVHGSGVFTPEDTRWLATDVTGRVERILKMPGAVIKQGELLMVLSNPQLEQQLAEAQWGLQALEAEITARRVAAESDLLDQEIAVLTEKLNHERARLTMDAQQSLLEKGIVAISRIDYEEVKIDVSQFEQLHQLERKRLAKRRENLQAQIAADRARLGSMRRLVERIQQQVSSLQVRATMDSLLQAMPVALGQQIPQGSNLALLARTDQFIAQLHIPEQHIKDVQLGQKVMLNTQSNTLWGKVQRIDPAVMDSSVQVDVALSDELPAEIRPAMNVDGEIMITTLPDTLYVKRPMYASRFSAADVYLVDPSITHASKHPVKFGHMSSRFIQIEAGLEAGQQIIVSDPSGWEQHTHIRLN